MKMVRYVECIMNKGSFRPGRNPSRREFLKMSMAAGIGIRLAARPTFAAGQATSRPPVFREVAPQQSGITFVHTNGRSPHRFLPETEGGGVAIFDYNNDGLMDILFVDSGDSSFYHPPAPLHPVLYKNNGNGTFTDVSEQAGLKANLYGMGVAVGDYDRDGHPDVFISGYEKLVLYHNNGDGTFTDVTAQSGIEPLKWSTSALWFDYDNDGMLDLFVCSFADYDQRRLCGVADSYGGETEGAKGEFYYCIPSIFAPLPSHLYHNDGNGHFTDVSKETGILDHAGKGWGVVATDINNDGYLDLFQANDTMANFLFLNRDGKKFEEIGLEAGVAYSSDGTPRSGMGVDAADFDQDGWQDLFVDNINNQYFSLYRNNGDGTFDEWNQRDGFAYATRLLSGWGTRFFDYDNDGWPDLITADGHPDDHVDEEARMVTYREPLMLFHNEGKDGMVSASAYAGEAFQKKYAARGLAVGDLNNDGCLDVVFVENGGPAHVLMNTGRTDHHWIGLKLIGTTANRDAVGALIKWSAGGKVFSRLKTAGGSFIASSDRRDILGLGKASLADWVEIHWPRPSTRVERLTGLPVDTYLTVVEGKGMTGK